jgi:ATP-dependent Clp protease ATP-binding subunit ClpC
MLDRFADRGRLLALAKHEAQDLGHEYVGTEHLLLAVVTEGRNVASNALHSLGVTHARLQDAVVAIVGRGAGGRSGDVPFTPRAKKVLELALRESMQLGSQQIKPEHVLLGVIREGGGVAAHAVMRVADVGLREIRQATLQAIA